MLKSIKEQLRRIPNRGIGYGLLRYLNKDTETVKQLQALPRPEVNFKYLGTFDQILSDKSPFKLTNDTWGETRSLRGNRPYLLEVEAKMIENQLHLSWIYSQNVHQQSTIKTLAQSFINALKGLIVHCQSPEAGGYTPSDFPEVDLSQKELDDLLAEIRGIEG